MCELFLEVITVVCMGGGGLVVWLWGFFGVVPFFFFLLLKCPACVAMTGQEFPSLYLHT